MNNLDWLNELKVGDQVVRISTMWGSYDKTYDVYTIEKITPTGRINLDRHGYVLDQKTGRIRGNNSSEQFVPMTKEMLDEVENYNKVLTINKILNDVNIFSQDKDKIDTLYKVLIDLDLKDKEKTSRPNYSRK